MKYARHASIVGVCAVALALALSGCSSNSQGSSADAKQTITVWGWAGAPGAAVEAKIISAFEKKYPNIKVKYVEGSQTDYGNKVALALSSGQVPDVVGLEPDNTADRNGKYLDKVSSWPGGDAFLKKIGDLPLKQDKKLWSDGVLRAVPFDTSGASIGYYNADLIKKAGLTSPPRTWADFQQLVAGLKKNAPGVVAAVVPGVQWVQNDFSLTLAGQKDAEYYNNFRYHNGKWDTPALVTGLTDYQSLYSSGILTRSTLDLDYAHAMALFDSGGAAVVFTGTWESDLLSPAYRAENKVTASDVGVIPVPAANPKDDSLRSFVDAVEAIPSKSTHKAAAAKYIEFETAGAGVDAWAPSLVGLPAVKDYKLPDGVLKTPLEQSSYAEIQNLIAHPHSDRYVEGAFQVQAGGYAQQVAQGTLTPQEAAAKGQADWDSGKYN